MSIVEEESRTYELTDSRAGRKCLLAARQIRRQINLRQNIKTTDSLATTESID